MFKLKLDGVRKELLLLCPCLLYQLFIFSYITKYKDDMTMLIKNVRYIMVYKVIMPLIITFLVIIIVRKLIAGNFKMSIVRYLCLVGITITIGGVLLSVFSIAQPYSLWIYEWRWIAIVGLSIIYIY